MLHQDELRRRIRAARVLADISQADMNKAGEKRGLRKHALGAVERGDAPVEHVHLAMLCEILGVPMSWFTETREVIVAQRAADYMEAFNELLELTREAAPARTAPEGDGGRVDELDELGRGDEDQERSAEAGGQT